jgi:hypothetical protein
MINDDDDNKVENTGESKSMSSCFLCLSETFKEK